MYILYTVTLKVAEGLFNQSNAEYICSKSLKKKKGKKERKNGTTEVSCSLTIYGWIFTGNKTHAYLAKTRVEKAEMKYLVCTGDLNFRKLSASMVFSLCKEPGFEIEFLS